MRVYPEPGSRLFVRVVVFPRRWQVQALGRQWGVPVSRARQFRAFCAEFAPPDRAIACVALWHRDIGVGIVAHELLHATLSWARRRGAPFGELGGGPTAHQVTDTSLEERMARAHEQMVRQFVVRAYALRLYPEAA